MGDYKATGVILSKVTYLEMNSLDKDHRIVKPDVDTYQIEKKIPSLAFYRDLYHMVGESLRWSARKLMSDQELAVIIHSPQVEIFILWVGERTAGFIELDFRESSSEVEIGLFGIAPDFYGKKLGPYLLSWGIDYIWSRPQTKRFWLHTCDLDHPKMLEAYQRFGFIIFKEQIEEVEMVE